MANPGSNQIGEATSMGDSVRKIFSDAKVFSDNFTVREFDSVLQAQRWTAGTKAAKTMLGIVRTAVLFSGSIALSHAELFDGIFFLEWGPDQLAWELSLGPQEPLPIVVYSNTTDVNELRKTVTKMESSAAIAINCAETQYSWLYPQFEASDHRDASWLAERREQWFTAINSGRIQLRHWDTRSNERRELDLRNVMVESLSGIGEIPADFAQLFVAVLSLEADGSYRTTNDAAGIWNGTRLLEYLAVTPELARSTMLRHVDQLTDDPEARELLFQWWNNCYLRAICVKNSADYLAFTERPRITHSLRYELGLESKPLSTWQLFWRKISHQEGRQTLSIQGDLIDDMCRITPSLYAEVRFKMQLLMANKDRLDGSVIADISLQVKEILKPPSSRFERAKWALIRALIFGIGGVLLVLHDANILPSNGILIAGWTILGIMLAIPWDDVSELWDLRPTNISAKLTLAD